MSSSPVPTSPALTSSALAPSRSTSATTPLAFWPTFFCEHCGCLMQFVGVARAIRLAGVSRSTIYYWMEHGWLHWRVLPNRRRVICLGSLSRFGLDIVRGSSAPRAQNPGATEIAGRADD